MRRRDVAAAVAAITFLAVALHLFVLNPLRREHAKARARQRLELAMRSGDPVVSIRAARASLEDLDRYRLPMGSDVETQVNRAAA